jgi:hypothetical protein
MNAQKATKREGTALEEVEEVEMTSSDPGSHVSAFS